MWSQPTAAQRVALTSVTSRSRLRPFRRSVRGHEDPALDLYILDAQIASLLHEQLRFVEIVLREQLNQALITRYGDHWHRLSPDGLSTPAGLGNTCRDMVRQAHTALRREGSPLSSGKIVAELMMGFCVTARHLVAVAGLSGSRGRAYPIAPAGVSGSTPTEEFLSPRVVRSPSPASGLAHPG